MRVKSSRPFTDVRMVEQPDGSKKVEASILNLPVAEGAYVHSALYVDGSNSLRDLYGIGPFGGLNYIQAIAKGCGEFLAGLCDGKVSMHYWACGPEGEEIVEIGNLTLEEILKTTICGPPPKKWGRGTKLLPALKRAVEGDLKFVAWGMGVFITDGTWTDFAEVKEYSQIVAKNIAEKKRGGLKLVVVGAGDEIDNNQLKELDSLKFEKLIDPSTGAEIKLWDTMIAAEMKDIKDLVAGVSYRPVTMGGKLLDDKNNLIASYPDKIPPKLSFVLPSSSKFFTLKIGKKVFKQALA